MTLGQRIQELRKQRGLSQEGLGEALGVSRQAVSKWEGDNGIPELDTLIAMSRLFEVTVGRLLGVEQPPAQAEDAAPGTQADQAESVLRRYVEQTSKTDDRARAVRRGGILCAAIVIVAVFVVMFAQLGALRNTVRLLRSDLSSLQVNVSHSQNNLSGQIRNTIYDVLAEEAKLLNTFRWEIADCDLEQQTVTLQLDASMKEYSAGSRLQFSADWQTAEGTAGQTVSDWVSGPDFRAALTLPMNYLTQFIIRVEDTEGNIKEQLIENDIYDLHPDRFRLCAYNLTAPFTVTVKHFGTATTTVSAEQAYIEIVSAYPDFFWPEKAELTAWLNGTELMHEFAAISPSEQKKQEKQVFTAAIPDTGYDLIMKDGDVLEVRLIVTDNLGRTEQFDDSIAVKNGRPESAPMSAPAVSVNG